MINFWLISVFFILKILESLSKYFEKISIGLNSLLSKIISMNSKKIFLALGSLNSKILFKTFKK